MDLRDRIRQLYREHPQATMADIITMLDTRNTVTLRAAIVDVQNSMRGRSPAKRKNNNNGRLRLKPQIRWIPPESQ